MPIKRECRGCSLDNLLVIGGMVLEAALVALLWHKRVYRPLPFFSLYLAWGLVSDSIMLILQRRYASHYIDIFLGEMSIDTVLQYLVLVELSWSVLQPYRASLPRRVLVIIPLVLAGLGAITWPLANLRGFEGFPAQWHFLAHLQASIAVLRVLFFLVIAGGSHLLALGWRDRELQVATGLGFFSMVSLAASIVHSYQKLGHGYHVVDIAVSASYALSLFYWLGSFLQKEVPRREFSPHMRSFLPALAGAARLQREAMASSMRPGTQEGK